MLRNAYVYCIQFTCKERGAEAPLFKFLVLLLDILHGLSLFRNDQQDDAADQNQGVGGEARATQCRKGREIRKVSG